MTNASPPATSCPASISPSSCLLPPNRPSNSSPNNNSSMSVTLISKTKLHPICSERFYLLSEIQLNARSCTFLSDYSIEEGEDNATEQTTEESFASQEEEQVGVEDKEEKTTRNQEEEEDEKPAADEPTTSEALSPTSKFAEFIILYVLWASSDSGHDEDDPNDFTETCLVRTVESLKQHVDITPSIHHSSSPLSRRSSFDSASGSSRRMNSFSERTSESRFSEINSSRGTQDEGGDPTTTTVTLPKASVYLVVDRVCPQESDNNNDDDDTRQQQQQDLLAERLARAVAAHSVLRLCLQGVTVGVSNHVRAAPGLDACVQAVLWGAPDRRRYKADGDEQEQNKHSMIGIVAHSSDELLGLQSSHVTDAAEGIAQSLVTAEWNGHGNLESFAARAHACWSQRCGVAVSLTHRRRRAIPRLRPWRRNRNQQAGGGDKLDRLQFWYDVVAFCFIAGFTFFHYGKECKEFVFWVSEVFDETVARVVHFR